MIEWLLIIFFMGTTLHFYLEFVDADRKAKNEPLWEARLALEANRSKMFRMDVLFLQDELEQARWELRAAQDEVKEMRDAPLLAEAVTISEIARRKQPHSSSSSSSSS